jgi:hypothetical protein
MTGPCLNPCAAASAVSMHAMYAEQDRTPLRHARTSVPRLSSLIWLATPLPPKTATDDSITARPSRFTSYSSRHQNNVVLSTCSERAVREQWECA